MSLKHARAWLRGRQWHASAQLAYAVGLTLTGCLLVAIWIDRRPVSSNKNPSGSDQQLSSDLIGTLGNPRGSITDKLGVVRGLAGSHPEAPLGTLEAMLSIPHVGRSAVNEALKLFVPMVDPSDARVFLRTTVMDVSKPIYVRERALVHLARMFGDPEQHEWIRRTFHGPAHNTAFRDTCAVVLAEEFGDEEVVPYLLERITDDRDPDPERESYSGNYLVGVLGKLGGDRSRDALALLARESPNADLRVRALADLTERGVDVSPELRHIASSRDAPPDHRALALRMLVFTHDAKCADLFLSVLKDPTEPPQVRQTAALNAHVFKRLEFVPVLEEYRRQVMGTSARYAPEQSLSVLYKRMGRNVPSDFLTDEKMIDLARTESESGGARFVP